MPGLLTIRKLADKSKGARVRRYDPDTGQPYLSDPDSSNPRVHSPWPLAGIRLEVAPDTTSISTTKVAEGVREGWLELVGERVSHAPGGPADQPWKVTHTFPQADALIFYTVDGLIRYTVTGQPGKYPDPAEPSGWRVDWFFTLTREG